MILFDQAIREARKAGDIVIEPFIDEHLGVNSYDVRLGDELRMYMLGRPSFGPESRMMHEEPSSILDMRQATPCRTKKIPPEGYVLQPGILYLASTMETIGTTGKYVPHIEGRSSVGRLGLAVHITAGFGDVGFVGRWTLEMTVVHPLRVYAGERVAQAYFIEGKGEPSKLYDGKYAGETEPIASRMHEDER